MKPRVLLSILCILFAMFSCTSESDILNDMASQDKTGSDTYTTLSFSIKNETATKATQDAEGEEGDINNVIYFLLEGENVIGSQEAASDAVCEFTTKEGKNLSVIAVVNASTTTASTLKDKTTREEIKSVALNNEDLMNFIKFGDQKVNLLTPLNEVAVTQVAARIDLASLTVNVESSNKSITLKSVELKNQNINGKLNMEAQALNAKNIIANLDPSKTSLVSGMATQDVATLYSFANNGNDDEVNATSMVLTFDVNGQTVVKEFKIKHNEEGYLIKAGHLYQLNVTVSVKNPEINLTVTVVKWTDRAVEVSFGKKN